MLYRCRRHMKRSIFDVRVLKGIICVGDFFSIAIDISQAAATREGIVSDAGHAEFLAIIGN